jgi:hypothetical protein
MTAFRYLLSGAGLILPMAAAAQNTTQPPATIPGVERFSLPPSGTQPSPAPTPAPSPPPVVPPIAVVPTAAPTPSNTAPAARPTPRAVRPAASVAPVQTPTPTPVPSATPTVIAAPTPVPEPTSSPVAAEPAAAPSLPWPWIAGGVGALLIAFAIGWALGRRRSPELLTYQPEFEPEPRPDPVPVAPTPPLPRAQPTPPPAPVAREPSRATQPLTLDLRPSFIDVEDSGASLGFELIITNSGSQSADGLRAVVGLLTAGPDLDQLIGQFNVNAAIAAADDPVTLAPGQAHRVAGQIALAREQMHIASAAGRPMMVPVLVVNLRWRAGLSIRSGSEAFMIGTGDGTSKLGPIWLDRGRQRFTPLAVRRFDPDPLRG